MNNASLNAAHEHPWKISDVVLFPLLALAILAEFLWPTTVFGFPSWIPILIGVGYVGAGFWLIDRAKQTLDQANQPNLPGTPTTQLLTGGAFQLSRNPNYLGAIMIAVGLALIVDSWWFWGCALLGAIILDRWMIAPEERYLAGKFGDEYEAYRAQVRRWL